jgi:hypothetical protein
MSSWALAGGVILALDTVETTNTLDALATSVAAIKAKTDSLAFTVAGQVDANTKSIQGSAISGAGTEADPWGP